MHCILRGRNPEAFGGVCGAQIAVDLGGHVGLAWFEDTSWMSEEVSKKVSKWVQ